jgi:hypothetical protein
MLRDSLNKVLYPLFGTEPAYFTDNEEIFEFLNDNCCSTYYIPNRENYSSLKVSELHRNNAVTLVTNGNVDYERYHSFFKDSKMLFIPLHAFGSDGKSGIYTIKKLAHSNFLDSTTRNGEIIETLATTTRLLRLQGIGTDLFCELKGKVDIMYAKREVELRSSEWEPIASYCKWLWCRMVKTFFTQVLL